MHFNRMDTTTCIIYNSSSPPSPARQQALDRVRVVIGPEDLQGPVPGAHPLARDKLF